MNARQDLDRLTRSDALEGLVDWPVQRVRELRDACRDAEEKVSYHRRIAQGRLDIALAERERRANGGDLVDALPGILADRPTGAPHSDRAIGIIDLDHDDMDDEPSITDLPDLSSDGLSAAIERLAVTERNLSGQRRGLLDNLDRLQDELVTRYRDGRAEIGQVVGPGEA
jgi:hypothetical protein